MDAKDHPHMLCDVEVQGVALKLLMPTKYEDEELFFRGPWHKDLPEWMTPKLFPPWNRKSKMPYSLLNVKDGTVVLDIGAAYGLFTILVAKTFPKVKILAVEPNDWMAVLLTDNLARNGVPEGQVHILANPVSGDGRDVAFLSPLLFSFVANMYAVPHNEEEHGWDYGLHNFSKTSITLKQLLATKGFEGMDVSYAKVDCMGCEQEIMQEVADLNVPFWMECQRGPENSKYAKREWQVVPHFTHVSEEDALRCLDLQELGENRLLWGNADAGRPVEAALLGLQLLADGNRSSAMQMLSAVSLEKAGPQTLASKQYTVLAHALWQVSAFLQASALESGDGIVQDRSLASAIFEQIASSSKLEELGADYDGFKEQLPMLADVKGGSMYRLAEILAQEGMAERANGWYQRAAAEGHGLAAALLHSQESQGLVGTNGRVSGTSVRQLLTKVRLEALGIPPNLQLPLLGAATSPVFDECMRQDQASSLERFEDVFAGLGLEHSHMEAYRFRSWLQSAMACMLKLV